MKQLKLRPKLNSAMSFLPSSSKVVILKILINSLNRKNQFQLMSKVCRGCLGLELVLDSKLPKLNLQLEIKRRRNQVRPNLMKMAIRSKVQNRWENMLHRVERGLFIKVY